MIDQTTGNGWRSIVTAKTSGSPIFFAIQVPRSAPMKPTATETRQPPRVPPAIARPIAPQIAAITSRTRRPVSENVMAPPSQICQNDSACSTPDTGHSLEARGLRPGDRLSGVQGVPDSLLYLRNGRRTDP